MKIVLLYAKTTSNATMDLVMSQKIYQIYPKNADIAQKMFKFVQFPKNATKLP